MGKSDTEFKKTSDTAGNKLGWPGKGCLFLALVAVLLFSLILWHFVTWRKNLEAENMAMQAQLRNDGIPATLSELDIWTVAPPGPNSFEKWDAVLNRIPDAVTLAHDTSAVYGTGNPNMNAPYPPAQKARAKSVLALYEKDLNALRQLATEGTPCRFNCPIKNWWMKGIPHLNKMGQLPEMLSVDILYELSQGEAANRERVLQDLLVMKAMIETLQAIPLDFPYSFQSGMQEDMQTCIQRIAYLNGPLWRQMAQSYSIKGFTQDPAEMQKRLAVGDLLFAMNYYDQLSGNTTPYPVTLDNTKKAVQLAPFLNITGHLAEDRNYHFKTMRKLIDICKEPLEKRWKSAKAIQKMRSRDLNPGLHQLRFVSKRSHLPSDAFTGRQMLITAFWHTIHTAMAIEVYRQSNAALPGTLADLVPEFLDAVPQDPFDGKPLRYRKTSPGFIVYSIGEDLKDDGGKMGAMADQIWFDYDIVFVVPH